MLEQDGAPASRVVHRDREEPSLDAMEAVVGLVLTGRTAGVLVARRTDRELLQAGLRMHRVILPVPVAADREKVVGHIVAEPRADLVAFVLEDLVGVIVGLGLAVGADERRGADQELPRRVALLEACA